MVNILTENMVNVGRELIERLDNKDLSINAALWLYSSDSDSWKLLISSPQVRHKGPRHLYKLIQSILFRFEKRPISLSDISVLDDRNKMISNLKTAIHTGKGFANIRFTHNFVNGILVEDAYIYRLN